MSLYVQDPINIKGLGSLLNPQMGKTGASFIELEDEITRGTRGNHTSRHREDNQKDAGPDDKFAQDLAALSQSFGLNLSTKQDLRKDNNNNNGRDHREHREEKREEKRDDRRDDRRDNRRSDGRDYDSRQVDKYKRREESRSRARSSTESSYSDDGSETDYSSSYMSGSDSSGSYSGSSYSSRSRRSKRYSRPGLPPPPPFGWEYNGPSGDQANQQTLVSALDGGPNFTLERERYAELRSAKLEKIESMRQSLEEEGIDCSKIDVVTSEDADEKIEATYRTLSHKIDRQRYCSLAEELVLAGVGGLESMFDGKRIYFGKYRPDLTNWNVTVQAKLRRVRPETAMLVGQIMRDYNISPMWRIGMELIPSAISHMRLRAKMDEKSGIFHDPELSKAIIEIRGTEDENK